mgnify:CR=1 FL=1|jgi:DNA polymerase elongation subunit (family B)
MSKKLKQIKQRFVDTMNQVGEVLDVCPTELRRDDYVRISVDTDIEDRLNKEELNLIGGFKSAKKSFIKGKKAGPKILLFDLETTPIEAYVWGLWDQNIGLSMVKEESSLLSWSAKWLGDDKVMYDDVSGQKNLRDDKRIVQSLLKLVDEADIIVGHNSDSFDVKVMNARVIKNGLKPPSSYKRMDTKKMAKKHFRFLSNKLQYLTDSLCTEFKKSSHGKFPGFSMWKECLKGNKEAFQEMKEYNILDVTSLEELFVQMLPWESASIFNTYKDNDSCTCGHNKFKKSGFAYTPSAKYQKYKCKKCGAESRGTENLNLRKSTKKNTVR